jgi:hypothetical protein
VANSFQTLRQLAFKGDTLRPQSVTGATNGVAVDASLVGANFLSALLSVGAVSSLTSLDVKIQASADGATGWTDISGAAFTQVTAANALEVIDFQMPTAASNAAAPYRYVRAVAAIVGTSALAHCVILGCNRYDGANAFHNGPPTIN